MKKSFIKILMSLLLLIIPIMYFTNDVNATKNFTWVDASHIDLSPESLLDAGYLNSPQMKEFLVRCIEQSECLQTRGINEIKFKFQHVEFFCLESSLYDDQERPLLRLWVPADIDSNNGKGILYTIPLECGLRLRSNSI